MNVISLRLPDKHLTNTGHSSWPLFLKEEHSLIASPFKGGSVLRLGGSLELKKEKPLFKKRSRASFSTLNTRQYAFLGASLATKVAERVTHAFEQIVAHKTRLARLYWQASESCTQPILGALIIAITHNPASAYCG